jgi:hypothetical protein
MLPASPCSSQGAPCGTAEAGSIERVARAEPTAATTRALMQRGKGRVLFMNCLPVDTACGLERTPMELRGHQNRVSRGAPRDFGALRSGEADVHLICSLKRVAPTSAPPFGPHAHLRTALHVVARMAEDPLRGVTAISAPAAPSHYRESPGKGSVPVNHISAVPLWTRLSVPRRSIRIGASGSKR